MFTFNLSHLVDLKQAFLVTLFLIPHVLLFDALDRFGSPHPRRKGTKNCIVVLWLIRLEILWLIRLETTWWFFWEDVGTSPSSKNKLFPFNEIWHLYNWTIYPSRVGQPLGETCIYRTTWMRPWGSWPSLILTTYRVLYIQVSQYYLKHQQHPES